MPCQGIGPFFWGASQFLGRKTGELPRKNWGAPQKKLGSLPEKLGFENPGQDKSDFTTGNTDFQKIRLLEKDMGMERMWQQRKQSDGKDKIPTDKLICGSAKCNAIPDDKKDSKGLRCVPSY